ncbi:MAG TPA: hypothetical protein VM925_35690, partial [Labilithrix sp.]|nr:hypothetical protein [Labilithrix sp.]
MKRLGIVGCVLGLASIAGCGSAGSEGTKASEDEVISTSCSSLSLEALRPGAREFLLAQGLGSANEEGVIIPDLMATRWTALKIIEPLVENRGSTCLVVMNLATVTKTQDGDAVEPTMEFEVIAVDKATKAFERFEKSIAVPERLQAAYGPARVMMSDGGWQVETSFYYVELTGSSKVLDTWKAVAAGIEISGFAAHLSAKNVKHEGDSPTGEPDGKAEFDPTPNRTW